MSHGTRMNESCYTYTWVMAHVWMSHEWVMLHIYMCHGMRMNESCYTYTVVMAHVWMSHATHIHVSCNAYTWIMAHVWMSHGTRMNESCYTYTWVMAHVWMSHGTHILESWHTYEWVMLRIYMSHGRERRRRSHWNWKLRIVPRILRYPPEKLSFQFSTNSGLQVSLRRKKHILEYPVPIPSNPLIFFINGRSFPGLGRFELLTHASRLGWHITSKIVWKSL